MFRKPSNDRNWKRDFEKMAWAELKGDTIILHNVRNNRYNQPGEKYSINWEDRCYKLSTLRRLWFLLEPFHPTIDAIAHPFLSFEFEDTFLAVSIEARVTRGNRYSIAKGLVGNYELIYSFGDEHDFIVRRTCFHEHAVYLYPLITPPIEVATLLLGMLANANALTQRPRLYNSVSNNCTNVLRRHANQVRPGSFLPFIWADLLPGLSDIVLFKKGWIATNANLKNMRKVHSIKDIACKVKDHPRFSMLIREQFDGFCQVSG